MFAKITHKGLNGRRDAARLHHMISEGYRRKFEKEEKPAQPSPQDKQAFIEAIEKEESEYLMGGFTYA